MLVQTTQQTRSLEEAQDVLAGIKNLDFFIFGYIIHTAKKISVVSVMTCADGAICRGLQHVMTVAVKDDALDLC
jgi:hypothetical protein